MSSPIYCRVHSRFTTQYLQQLVQCWLLLGFPPPQRASSRDMHPLKASLNCVGLAGCCLLVPVVTATCADAGFYCSSQPQLGWPFGRLSSGRSRYSNASSCWLYCVRSLSWKPVG